MYILRTNDFVSMQLMRFFFLKYFSNLMQKTKTKLTDWPIDRLTNTRVERKSSRVRSRIYNTQVKYRACARDRMCSVTHKKTRLHSTRQSTLCTSVWILLLLLLLFSLYTTSTMVWVNIGSAKPVPTIKLSGECVKFFVDGSGAFNYIM